MFDIIRNVRWEVTRPFIREVSHQYEYDNDYEHVINSFSNKQMVLHLQAENAHITKQINKIMFVWNITNLSERNGAIWTHVPTK
jgi:hypothetical protein